MDIINFILSTKGYFQKGYLPKQITQKMIIEKFDIPFLILLFSTF
jgi:hypothetical protein